MGPPAAVLASTTPVPASQPSAPVPTTSHPTDLLGGVVLSGGPPGGTARPGSVYTFRLCPQPASAVFTAASVTAQGVASGQAAGSGGCLVARVSFPAAGAATVAGIGSGAGGTFSAAVSITVG